jgi:hypothetical protein
MAIVKNPISNTSAIKEERAEAFISKAGKEPEPGQQKAHHDTHPAGSADAH